MHWVFVAVSRLFSRCSEQWLLSSCGDWASHCPDFAHCRERALGHVGFSSCRTQAQMPHGMRIFPDKGWKGTLVPCISRWILNHWVTRSDQISRSVVSDSLRPHESQHARLPCPSLPEFTETHVHRVSDAIQPSHPLSSPSPLAPNPSQHQSLFQ